MMSDRSRAVRLAERALVAVASAGAIAAATYSAAQAGAVVCAGADRVLRVEPSGKCPAGASVYTVVAAVPKDASTADGAEIRDLKSRVAALERELATSQPGKGHAGSHFTAPFEVDDAQGRPIFVVGGSLRGLEIKSTTGRSIVSAGVGDLGPILRVENEAGSSQAILGVSATTPQVILRGGGKRRVALYVSNSGESQLQLLTEGEVPSAVLTTGVTGNGSLKLYGVSGDLNVGAGTTAEGFGVVQVGPVYSCVGRPAPFVSACLKGHKAEK